MNHGSGSVNSEASPMPEQVGQREHREEKASAHVGHEPVPAATTRPSMSPTEQALWAMSFEDLFEHAKSKGFGRTKKESRKSGRVRIIKWILQKEGVVPYIAPRDTNSSAPGTIPSNATSRTLNANGAVPHPEAVLQTLDPVLQRQIDVVKIQYLTCTYEELLALAMQRSYQLFKDNAGKMPSRSRGALVNWLASWDVLKSDREKRWWLGDGIDLVNRAKAMGFEGGGAATKKYDVIVWLRSTTEEAEEEVARVAEPTPVSRSAVKRKRTTAAEDKGEAVETSVSRRPAKGSRRPRGWDPGHKNLLGALTAHKTGSSD